MQVSKELGRVALVVLVTVFFVAFLQQVPGLLAAVLLVPLAIAFWFWPDSSTALSYFVGALVGLLFSYWSFMSSPNEPAGLLGVLWIPLVWGPAGVIIKRFELLIASKRQERKSTR